VQVRITGYEIEPGGLNIGRCYFFPHLVVFPHVGYRVAFRIVTNCAYGLWFSAYIGHWYFRLLVGVRKYSRASNSH